MSKVALEVKENIAYLAIQSPPANALSNELLNDLEEKLNEVEENDSIKAVIIRGEGRFFSAGADINGFTQLQNGAEAEQMAKDGQALFERIEKFPVPVIAAIHGAALGGGLELAMACHIRIVTETAKLGLPELNLGLIPGFAGTQRLPQLVGNAKAYEMILTGEPITGVEAVNIGLANQVVKDDELLAAAENLAKKIAAKSKPSIQKIMELVPYAKYASFSAGVVAEAEAFGDVFETEDAKEGVQAFLEKRKPNFKDK